MIQVLLSDRDSVELKDQICWAIGNVAGDSDEFRQVLLANGCLPAVLKQLQQTILVALAQVEEGVLEKARTAAWALSNLARGSGVPGAEFVRSTSK